MLTEEEIVNLKQLIKDQQNSKAIALIRETKSLRSDVSLLKIFIVEAIAHANTIVLRMLLEIENTSQLVLDLDQKINFLSQAFNLLNDNRIIEDTAKAIIILLLKNVSVSYLQTQSTENISMFAKSLLAFMERNVWLAKSKECEPQLTYIFKVYPELATQLPQNLQRLIVFKEGLVAGDVQPNKNIWDVPYGNKRPSILQQGRNSKRQKMVLSEESREKISVLKAMIQTTFGENMAKTSEELAELLQRIDERPQEAMDLKIKIESLLSNFSEEAKTTWLEILGDIEKQCGTFNNKKSTNQLIASALKLMLALQDFIQQLGRSDFPEKTALTAEAKNILTHMVNFDNMLEMPLKIDSMLRKNFLAKYVNLADLNKKLADFNSEMMQLNTESARIADFLFSLYALLRLLEKSIDEHFSEFATRLSQILDESNYHLIEKLIQDILESSEITDDLLSFAKQAKKRYHSIWKKQESKGVTFAPEIAPEHQKGNVDEELTMLCVLIESLGHDPENVLIDLQGLQQGKANLTLLNDISKKISLYFGDYTNKWQVIHNFYAKILTATQENTQTNISDSPSFSINFDQPFKNFLINQIAQLHRELGEIKADSLSPELNTALMYSRDNLNRLVDIRTTLETIKDLALDLEKKGIKSKLHFIVLDLQHAIHDLFDKASDKSVDVALMLSAYRELLDQHTAGENKEKIIKQLSEMLASKKFDSLLDESFYSEIMALTDNAELRKNFLAIKKHYNENQVVVDSSQFNEWSEVLDSLVAIDELIMIELQENIFEGFETLFDFNTSIKKLKYRWDDPNYAKDHELRNDLTRFLKDLTCFLQDSSTSPFAKKMSNNIKELQMLLSGDFSHLRKKQNQGVKNFSTRRTGFFNRRDSQETFLFPGDSLTEGDELKFPSQKGPNNFGA